MNRNLILSGIVWAAIIMIIPSPGVTAEPPVDSNRITKEAQEVIAATRLDTAQQKEAIQRKVNTELVAIQKQLIALRGKAGEASASTRIALQNSVNELEKKKDAAKTKLEELWGAIDVKWNAMRARVRSALDELKNSYQEALSHLP